MRWIWVLVLCACNQVYGIDSTREIDAGPLPFYDAPPRTAPVCPPAGAPLQLSRALHQLPIQAHNCTAYTIAPDIDLAIALCDGVLLEGRIGDTMAPARGLEAVDPAGMNPPRLSPEGDTLYIEFETTTAATLRRFRRGADGTWREPLGPVALLLGQKLVGITPAPRHLVFAQNSGYAEYADLDLAQPLASTTYTAAGFSSVPSSEMLSPSGLRLTAMVFDTSVGDLRATMLTRASLDGAWGSPAPIDPPNVRPGVLAPDCSRYYFAGIGAVFYEAQP